MGMNSQFEFDRFWESMSCGYCGDPSVVLYPGGESSSIKDCVSEASKAFSHRTCLDLVHPLAFPTSHLPASKPMSLLYFFSACVSSKNNNPTTTPMTTNAVQTKFGSRYGYASNIEPGLKYDG